MHLIIRIGEVGRGNGPTYEYDPTGRLTKRTWARGIETDYTYNSLGQLTSIIYSDLDTPDVAFTYNRMGQQATVTDATGTRCFAYDTSLQQIQETSWLATLERTYDTLGRPTGLTLGTNYSVSYTYDPYSRLATVADFTYTYFPNSDLIASVNNGPLQTTTTYEPHRNLKTAISNTFNGTLISSFDYTYDAIGRRTERLDSNTITNEFEYNPRSELISVQMGTNTFQYHYDPIGNRIHSSANEITNDYHANELNQYTNITSNITELTYDLDGNLLDDGTWQYLWDAENRLISVSSNNTLFIQNQYDYMSRRISKTTAITTNTFTYDNWNLISESSTAHTNNSYYIWGLDLSTTFQGAGGVGGLLAQIRPEIDSPLFPQYDANGNVTELVDTNGIIAAHYKYDGFGNTITQSGAHINSNPFRFSTKYWDGETRLYYYGYRFYVPEIGRWRNLDPAGLQGGQNLYGVVYNNFVNITDYLGLACCCKKLNIFTRQGSIKTIEEGVGITIQPLEILVLVEVDGNPDECACKIIEQAWNGITRYNPYLYEERREEKVERFSCFFGNADTPYIHLGNDRKATPPSMWLAQWMLHQIFICEDSNGATLEETKNFHFQAQFFW